MLLGSTRCRRLLVFSFVHFYFQFPASGQKRWPQVSSLLPLGYCLAGVYSLQATFFFSFVHFYFPASGKAVATGIVPSSPRFLPSISIAHRVQQSHCSSIFQRVLLTPRSRAYRKSICAREKVPSNFTSILVGKWWLLVFVLRIHTRKSPSFETSLWL